LYHIYDPYISTRDYCQFYFKTDSNQSGVTSTFDRAGDVSGEPPTNEATNRKTASKMANLFPATKDDIKNHINRKSPAMGNRINDVFEALKTELNITALMI
jgi:hypothetical protein